MTPIPTKPALLTFTNGRETFRAPAGKTFSLVMTGDCCPWESGLAAIRAGRAAELTAAVKPFIASADIKLMQWEPPLTGADTPIDKSGPNLKCPPDSIALMTALGIDVALLANNHTGDYGGSVVMETISHLQAAGLKTVGAGETPEAAGRPLILQARGIRLALFNFAEHEFGTVAPGVPGCAPLDPPDNMLAIRKAAESGDLVVVVVHGGHEYNPLPSPRMTNTYRAFVEAGAAAVINCHTHCPEGIELWKGAPIVYSPGNFFFPWKNISSSHLNALWWIGYLPKLHFDERGVYAMEVLPFRFDNERIHALPPADESGFYGYLAELNSLIADADAVSRYFDAWTAQHGGFYLAWIRDRLAAWPIDLASRPAVRDLLPVRNMFTCESHHDMIARYLRLVEEGRVTRALDGWPAVQRLQSPDWAERHWQAMRNRQP